MPACRWARQRGALTVRLRVIVLLLPALSRAAIVADSFTLPLLASALRVRLFSRSDTVLVAPASMRAVLVATTLPLALQAQRDRAALLAPQALDLQLDDAAVRRADVALHEAHGDRLRDGRAAAGGRRGRPSATATASATAGRRSGCDRERAARCGAAVPSLSTARTATLCAPAARPANAFGLVHAANAPPSRLHSIRVDVPVRAREPHAGGRARDVDAVDRGARRRVVVADLDAVERRGHERIAGGQRRAILHVPAGRAGDRAARARVGPVGPRRVRRRRVARARREDDTRGAAGRGQRAPRGARVTAVEHAGDERAARGQAVAHHALDGETRIAGVFGSASAAARSLITGRSACVIAAGSVADQRAVDGVAHLGRGPLDLDSCAPQARSTPAIGVSIGVAAPPAAVRV